MAAEQQGMPAQPLGAHKILAEQQRRGGHRYPPAVLAMAERAITSPAGEGRS